MVRPRKVLDQQQKGSEDKSLLQRLQDELQLNQSYLSLILGILIILVAGILVFNYLKTSQQLGPAQQIESPQPKEDQKDVTPDKLPGKYTVKDGDTLFKIAQSYYKDGHRFDMIAEVNNLVNPDHIEKGQVITIPKLELPSPSLSPSPLPSPSPIETPKPDQTIQKDVTPGKRGIMNQTAWGETITSDTYIVVEGDWLSKIAGRAYGDIYTYEKVARANNIPNPDLIFPGQVLKIPR